MNTKNDLIKNLDKIHTTKMGLDRINRNLSLNLDDTVLFIKKIITDKDSIITKQGKNYYIKLNNYKITINASSYTIITAHKIKKEKVNDIKC